MKTKTSLGKAAKPGRQIFSRDKREALLLLVNLREKLESLMPYCPIHREEELNVCRAILEEHMNVVLDGGCLNTAQRVRELRIVGQFKRHLQRITTNEENDDD